MNAVFATLLPTINENIKVALIAAHLNAEIVLLVTVQRYIHDSRLLYYIIREIKTWLNTNHITVGLHSNTYCIF